MEVEDVVMFLVLTELCHDSQFLVDVILIPAVGLFHTYLEVASSYKPYTFSMIFRATQLCFTSLVQIPNFLTSLTPCLIRPVRQWRMVTRGR